MNEDTKDTTRHIRRKIAELSKRISECDWEPDNAYTVKGHPIRYVTGQKLKRTIRPILNEMGLIFMIRIADVQALPPCGVKENHVMIRSLVSLMDADTGETIDCTVISEGADAGDKAILAGVSYAKRQFWINNFDIVDGMELMEDEGVVSSNDVAANLLRSAIPEAPENPTVPLSASVTSPHDGNIAKMQIKAMDNALDVIRKASEDGRIMRDQYERAVAIRQSASSKEDVQAILNIRKELGL